MEMRQLSLFKGKRQRGRKPPPPLEFDSHCFLADLLRRWCTPQWRFTHLPFGEKRHMATAKRLKRMGVTPGWPDFLFIGPGRVVWLELKRRGNTTSDEQDELFAHLRDCGFQVFVTDSVKLAVEYLKENGILPAKLQDITGV